MIANQNFCPITAGFMLRTMFEWENSISQERRKKTKRDQDPASWDVKFDNIPQDWMSGGLYLLSFAIANAIASVELDWDDGVFEYVYLDRDEENSLWRPIVEAMTADEWQDLCGNNIVPEWVPDKTVALMINKGLTKA